MAFFSRKLYRDVADNWGGKSWVYLFFILGLSWIAASFSFQKAASDNYDRYSALLVNQIPLMVLKDGVLHTTENRSYVINDPETGNVFAIIDTTGQYTEMNAANVPLFITQNAIITKPKQNETRTYAIPKNLQLLINPRSIDAFLSNLVNYIGLIFFVLFLFNSYVYRLFQVHLYGILGKLFAAMAGVRLFYPQVLQVAMVALTPTIVISSVLDYLQIGIPHQWVLFFALSIGYLFFGILANKKNQSQS